MTGFKLKKILLCCAAISVSLFALPTVTLGFTGDGLGTEDYPFRITNCDELVEIASSVSSHYVLLNDIDCSDSLEWNEGSGYYPPQNFYGSFDGRHNTISNLFSAYAGVSGGLFGSINGGTVKNVNVITSDFTFTSSYSGGIVGRCYNGCIVSGSSFSGSVSGPSYVGGLAGSIENSTIYQSWSTGDVDGNSGYPGGFVGLLSSSDVYDSYTTADVVNGGRSGGFASRIFTNGADTEVNISRVYTAGSLFAPNYRASFTGQFESYSSGGGITISDVISATAYDTNTFYNLVTFSGGNYNAPIYSNVVYDNTRANGDTYSNECDAYGADAECTDVDYNTLFNTSEVAPFYNVSQIWDFTNVWQIEAAGLPTLREPTLDTLNPLGAPGAPDSLATSGITLTEATLEWGEPLNGGAVITDYIINYRIVGAGSWTEIDTLSTSTDYDLSSLTEDTDYEFRIAAVNGNGQGEWSETETFATSAPSEPDAPGVLDTDYITLDSAVLYWSEPDSDGGAEITSYIINYREIDAESWTEVDTESTDTNYTLSDLDDGTDYEFRVAAVNSVGQGEWSEAEEFSTAAIVEVSTCQEFQDIVDYPYNSHFLLTQDIDCADFDEDGAFDPLAWEGDGLFGGTFDGQGHTISNLLINDDSIDAEGIYAIFPITSTGAVITNLGIEDANISVSNAIFAGILVGLATETEIDEVSVTGTMNVGVVGCDMFFCAFGGVIGSTYGPWDPGDGSYVTNSYSRVDVNLFDADDSLEGGVGGFVGVSGLTLYANSYAEGTIYIENMDYDFIDWGGFVGASLENAYVNSFSAVELTYEGEAAPGDPGGFMGYNDGGEYFENIYWLYNNDDVFTCDQDDDNEGCSMIDSGADYFKSISNQPLASWDFDEIWNIDSEINDGFPFLTFGESEEEEEEEVEEPAMSRSTTGSMANRYTLKNTFTETDSGPTSSTDFSFSDTSNHWAENYADKLKEKCDVFGYQNELGQYLKTFGPDNAITRAELVRMLIACKHVDGLSFEQHFPDVNESDWFGVYITYAYNQGWIEGYEDGEFKPNQPITRAEAIKIILLSHYTAEEIIGQEATFSDVDISAWYAEFVAFAEELGFVSGYTDEDGNKTGEFKPGNNITRGESAKIISLVLGL